MPPLCLKQYMAGAAKIKPPSRKRRFFNRFVQSLNIVSPHAITLNFQYILPKMQYTPISLRLWFAEYMAYFGRLWERYKSDAFVRTRANIMGLQIASTVAIIALIVTVWFIN